MAVETEQDRLNILSDFGVIAEVAGEDVLGILDREFKDIGGIETYYPIFECRRSDAPSVTDGDTVVFKQEDSGGGEPTTFHVVAIENDREGMQQLILAVGESTRYHATPVGGSSAYTKSNP